MSNVDLKEKNKSCYKLKGFGPIYYLNLDGQPERREYMEDQLKYWELEDYTRIPAYDGREDDLGGILSGKYPDGVTSGEVGCVTSHLKAIHHWYNTSDSPYAVIMEDDCDISIAKYWDFTWKEFVSRLPYDWDVIQLSIICTGDIHVKLHKRFVNDFSTACYIITRHHAKKILDLHVVQRIGMRSAYTGAYDNGNDNIRYKLDIGVKPRPVADDLIYNSGNTFSVPLLLYDLNLGSSIHPEHIDLFHKNSYEGIKNYWASTGSGITLDGLLNYDPYLGRITNPVSQERQNVLNAANTITDIIELKELLHVVVEKYMS